MSCNKNHVIKPKQSQKMLKECTNMLIFGEKKNSIEEKVPICYLHVPLFKQAVVEWLDEKIISKQTYVEKHSRKIFSFVKKEQNQRVRIFGRRFNTGALQSKRVFWCV